MASLTYLRYLIQEGAVLLSAVETAVDDAGSPDGTSPTLDVGKLARLCQFLRVLVATSRERVTAIMEQDEAMDEIELSTLLFADEEI